MNISELHIENLRNHSNTLVDFCNGINIITGLNGAGKTTILEAIYICCFSKSFQPTPEKELISKHKDFYSLYLKAKSDYKSNYNVNVSYKINDKKRISSSLGENLLPKDVIGVIPIVVLNPDYKNITFGAPQNRRDFVDKVLSQTNKLYFENLIKLKKALKQKNYLLSISKKNKHFDYAQIDTWSDLILELSTDIVFKRIEFVNIFKNYFFETYAEVSKNAEEIDLIYVPNGIGLLYNNIDRIQLKETFKQFQISKRSDEFNRGATIVGPQKDEIKIIVNGGIAKDYASQGQHKSLLISLKFAEFHFLKDRHNETPILLLDDIFAELDDIRSELVLNLINDHKVQTFITTTENNKFNNLLNNQINIKQFNVKDGITN
jgi:DNA replication and repair protein RecF